MSPRDRRLLHDNKQLHALVSGDDSIIRIRSEEGIPPDKYVIAYRLKGLQLDGDDNVIERDYHEMEIYLPLEYPRGQPQLKMLTPVFHPNIDPSHVCQGDFWGAEERLEDLIVRIAQLISYQDWNLQSPLDGKAAEWTENNLDGDLFPVDGRDVFPASRSSSSTTEELPEINLDKEEEDDLGIRVFDPNVQSCEDYPSEEKESSSEDELGIRILGEWENESTEEDKLDIRILGDWEKNESMNSQEGAPCSPSPRDNRLQQDNKALHAFVTGEDSIIRIKSEEGSPPDKYVIAYHLKGLQLDGDDNVIERDYHEMEIYLPLEYPRGQPQLKMLTPIFHPNINLVSEAATGKYDGLVDHCDFWDPEERLEDLIVRTARLISYQDFNLQSPLDGRAAEWTEKKLDAGLFPVDDRDFFPDSGVNAAH